MNPIDPKTMFKPFSTSGKNIINTNNQFLAKANDKGDNTDYLNEVAKLKDKCRKAVEELMFSIADESGHSSINLSQGTLAIPSLINNFGDSIYLAPFSVHTVQFDNHKGVTLVLDKTDIRNREKPLYNYISLSSIEVADIARTYEAVKKQIENPQVDINEQVLQGFYKAKDDFRAIMHDVDGNYYFGDFSKIFDNLVETFPNTSRKELVKMAEKKAREMYKEAQGGKK